jgi:hypothetical protein
VIAIDVPPEASIEDDELDTRVKFFARYEDAFGQEWETINPADVYQESTIRRVHQR